MELPSCYIRVVTFFKSIYVYLVEFFLFEFIYYLLHSVYLYGKNEKWLSLRAARFLTRKTPYDKVSFGG